EGEGDLRGRGRCTRYARLPGATDVRTPEGGGCGVAGRQSRGDRHPHRRAREGASVMTGALVIAEVLRGEVRDVTKELITAAAELDGPLMVAVIAPEPSTMRAQVDLAWVDEIIEVAVPGESFENDVQ